MWAPSDKRDAPALVARPRAEGARQRPICRGGGERTHPVEGKDGRRGSGRGITSGRFVLTFLLQGHQRRPGAPHRITQRAPHGEQANAFRAGPFVGLCGTSSRRSRPQYGHHIVPGNIPAPPPFASTVALRGRRAPRRQRQPPASREHSPCQSASRRCGANRLGCQQGRPALPVDPAPGGTRPLGCICAGSQRRGRARSAHGVGALRWPARSSGPAVIWTPGRNARRQRPWLTGPGALGRVRLPGGENGPASGSRSAPPGRGWLGRAAVG